MCSQMEVENLTKSFKNYFQKSPKITKNIETFFVKFLKKNLNNINYVKWKNTCSQMEIENLTESFKNYFQKSPKITKIAETFFVKFLKKNLIYIN